LDHSDALRSVTFVAVVPVVTWTAAVVAEVTFPYQISMSPFPDVPFFCVALVHVVTPPPDTAETLDEPV